MFSSTPPMGWNSWNFFGWQNLNEKVLYETADAMISKGFVDAGYDYLCIDDTWMSSGRDASGNLICDQSRFPHGIKALADYLHERNMKLGIYAGAGVMTYANRMGSYGYEKQDADLFASWGVDFLKYDFGYQAPHTTPDVLMRRMGQALRECGRYIYFAACCPSADITTWAKSAGCATWRLCGDIKDSWESIMSVGKAAANLSHIAGPGKWNDPDMMVVGLGGEGFVGKIGGGCTDTEYATHFAMWCMLSAPLIMGHDVRNTRPEIAEILLNKELIAINQDELGVAAQVLPTRSYNDYILFKPLANGDIAFCLINESENPKRMILSWDYCGWDLNDKISIRDVGSHKELGIFIHAKDFIVEPHAALTLRVTRI